MHKHFRNRSLSGAASAILDGRSMLAVLPPPHHRFESESARYRSPWVLDPPRRRENSSLILTTPSTCLGGLGELHGCPKPGGSPWPAWIPQRWSHTSRIPLPCVQPRLSPPRRPADGRGSIGAMTSVPPRRREHAPCITRASLTELVRACRTAIFSLRILQFPREA